MFSLERELIDLRDAGAFDAATAEKLIAIERRDVVNLYGELRFLTWAAVMVIVTGVGILVTKHLAEIGPLTLAAAIAAAAFACYAWATWKRNREPQLADGYVLLLGALLVSADTGYIEHTWHLLGSHWKAYLLALAIVHAATAYFFDSRLVLSVSLTSLAAWFGIQRDLGTLFDAPVETATRAVICAAMVFVWRFADARLRERRSFAPVFDHFATVLGLWGLVLLTENIRMWGAALLATLVAAALCCIHGIRTRSEAFVIYAWLAGLLVVDNAVDHFGHGVFQNITSLVCVILAIAGIILIQNRMRRERAA